MGRVADKIKSELYCIQKHNPYWICNWLIELTNEEIARAVIESYLTDIACRINSYSGTNGKIIQFRDRCNSCVEKLDTLSDLSEAIKIIVVATYLMDFRCNRRSSLKQVKAKVSQRLLEKIDEYESDDRLHTYGLSIFHCRFFTTK